jgi:hypothetical protein
MAAATASTVFSVTPISGIDVGAKGSTAPQGLKLKTKVTGSDGYVYMLVQANEAIGSITTCIISADGSASSDSGSAGWTANVPGGATAGQYFWARRTTLA